jgi:hypothetical protein
MSSNMCGFIIKHNIYLDNVLCVIQMMFVKTRHV